MKRRRFFQSIVAAPVASALLAQQQPQPSNQESRPPGAATEDPKLGTITPGEAGEPVIRFFTAEQFAALRRVSDLLMPPMDGMPGAIETRAPEFLDFLIGESLPDLQQIYRSGLDALNAEARRSYNKSFAEVDETQAKALLQPLREPWTYDLPADPLKRFLVTAKVDVRAATTNSREYLTAGSAGGRRMGDQGLYWNSLD
jgi:hypothetical protein